MKILHNHVGYAADASKVALLQSSVAPASSSFTVYDSDSREAVFRGPLQPRGAVQHWRDWQYWAADFSALRKPGRFQIAVDSVLPALVSQPFSIADPDRDA